jgi:hypothetical protein
VTPAAPQPVTLSRIFAANEKNTYRVHSKLQIQSRQEGLQVWIPEDLDLIYQFSTEVVRMKADGVVDMRYRRPSVTEIEGETFDAPPVRRNIPLNMDMLLTVSPLNRILDSKPFVRPRAARFMRPAQAGQEGTVFGDMLGEIYRLSVFVGSMDSSLDFAPPLPISEVKPGDTWQSTVSYQPQRARGQTKPVVQRLDFTYTYQGVVQSGSRKVHRVQGVLSLNTDLAEFFHTTLEASKAETGLSKLPLTLKATVQYDLDLKTCRTLAIRANSNGGFQIFTTESPDEPVLEQKLTGVTTMSPVAAPAPARRAPRRRG